MTDEELAADSNSVERVCPECDGTCYDEDEAPCRLCYGEGVICNFGGPNGI